VDRGSTNGYTVFFQKGTEFSQTDTRLVSCPGKPLTDSIFLLLGGDIIFLSASGLESENLLLVCVSHK
jgi:hypothetical protein